MTEQDLIGRWELVGEEGCPTTHPSSVEFFDGGVYAAPNGPDEGALWHGGDWALDGDDLSVQAANDAMVRYTAELDADGSIRLSDATTACTVTYARG